MHKLPPAGHPARELFEISDLVAIGTKERRAPNLPEALRSARLSFDADTTGALRRCVFIVHKCDDALWLVSVGPRGGWRKEWEFEPAYHRRGA